MVLAGLSITNYILPLLIVLVAILVFKGIGKLIGALFAWLLITALFVVIEYSTGFTVGDWVPTVVWAVWFFVFR